MMKGQIAGLMKQAQQMQEKMKVAQEQLAALEVTGQAAGGLVKVSISGKYEMKRVQIDPAAVRALRWLPPTCGYRLVSEGKDLPLWHHLVCGDRDAVHHERISQSGRMLAEGSVPEDDWEDHLIFRAG